MTASDGYAPYTFSSTGLPSGCDSSNTSSLDCLPRLPGNYSITVTVSDLAGETAILGEVAEMGSTRFNVSLDYSASSLTPKNGSQVDCAAALPTGRGDDGGRLGHLRLVRGTSPRGHAEHLLGKLGHGHLPQRDRRLRDAHRRSERDPEPEGRDIPRATDVGGTGAGGWTGLHSPPPAAPAWVWYGIGVAVVVVVGVALAVVMQRRRGRPPDEAEVEFRGSRRR